MAILPALFMGHFLFGQLPTDTVLTKADQMPCFLGCTELAVDDEARRACSNREMVGFISRYLVYPEEAKMNGVQGIVLVSFIVDENGMVQSPTVLSDIGGGCGEAALEVIRQMPKWEPARHEGQRVKVRLNLPVQFYLRAEEHDQAELFSLTWGQLTGKTVTLEELSEALEHAVHVRGPEGDTRFVDELEFLFVKRGRVVEGTGRGTITPELEEVVEKSKKGGTFTIRASVQEAGEFIPVVRSFKIVE